MRDAGCGMRDAGCGMRVRVDQMGWAVYGVVQCGLWAWAGVDGVRIPSRPGFGFGFGFGLGHGFGFT